MKNLLLILALLGSIHTSMAQSDCDIMKDYGAFIVASKFSHNDQTYLTKRAQPVPEGHCLSGIINPNLSYINYLITNFTSLKSPESLMAISDSLEFQNAFIEHLQQDSSFNAVMNAFTRGLKDEHEKVEFSTDEVMNIAVKFFSIVDIRNGNYVAKVCTGANDIKSTEKYREPLLEAFCFSTILKAIRQPSNGLMKDFTTGVKQLYSMNLGIDKKEELLRAQGAVFLTMKNSSALVKVLKDAYEQNKENLAFVWTEG